MELRWWSIEVLDGPGGSARAWRDGLGTALTEAAITHGAYQWEWHTHTWGVLFEVAFLTDERWTAYRSLPLVTAALDAVPDPVHGLYVYPGRGGSSGPHVPRRPRPIAGAGAAPLPVEDDELVRLARPVSGPPFPLAV
ncbi:hypothetical protein Ade02nite_93780 [Paractinoplanes deccanensis]|uniref:Uncharacterized protein n=1 Tax=Paractinoplanes deccanensis TaxID=113561 RepID=A0ABQ3YLA8_9ACTN|nr:hypothetical protein [Actinoplanes deccanensis]GID80737.1 hypothetical protein Ade02nite_93780 [Actinoplanes deccanensis]